MTLDRPSRGFCVERFIARSKDPITTLKKVYNLRLEDALELESGADAGDRVSQYRLRFQSWHLNDTLQRIKAQGRFSLTANWA